MNKAYATSPNLSQALNTRKFCKITYQNTCKLCIRIHVQKHISTYVRPQFQLPETCISIHVTLIPVNGSYPKTSIRQFISSYKPNSIHIITDRI